MDGRRTRMLATLAGVLATLAGSLVVLLVVGIVSPAGVVAQDPSPEPPREAARHAPGEAPGAEPGDAGDPLAELRRSLPADPAGARAALVEALHALVSDAEEGELAVASSLDRGGSAEALAARDTVVEATLATRARLVALLDTVVLRTEWGGQELERLRRRYPSSVLFLRYEAELAIRDARFEAAVAIYARLLAMRPDAADLHARQAVALEGLGREKAAIAAFTRSLEADPRDPDAFRALLRLRQAHGSLPALLSQVRRLRTLYPDVDVLRDRETELLHRMGEPLTDTAST